MPLYLLVTPTVVVFGRVTETPTAIDNQTPVQMYIIRPMLGRTNVELHGAAFWRKHAWTLGFSGGLSSDPHKAHRKAYQKEIPQADYRRESNRKAPCR